MRDIKFRAYDKIKNKMFTKVTVGNTCNSNHDDYTAHAYYDDDWLHFDELSDVELMQYTESKDKNGVEIYEGDILNFDWRLQATNELYADDCENIKGLVLFESAKFIVRYFNKSMSFDLSDVNQNTFERFWRETYVSAKDDYFKMTGFEVVGNIYQNPELIK